MVQSNLVLESLSNLAITSSSFHASVESVNNINYAGGRDGGGDYFHNVPHLPTSLTEHPVDSVYGILKKEIDVDKYIEDIRGR